MPIDFPTSPTAGQVYTYLGKSWVYNGTGWDSPRADIIEYLPSLVGGNTFTGVQTFTTPIAVPSGGTGVATLANGGYLKGAGTSAITSQSGIPAGDVTSGKLNHARMPAGSVLQVVRGTTTTLVTSTTNTFQDTTLTATITPIFSNSRLLVMIDQLGVRKTDTGQYNAIDLRILYPNGTDDFFAKNLTYTGTAVNGYSSSSYTGEYSPNSTSPQTIKTQFRNILASSYVSVQETNARSSITILEIAV
jgi:hypothetical protein